MNVAFESFFSERAKGMKASEIRELLKLTQAKDIISLAGGLPNPDAFPVDLVKKLAVEVLEKNGKSALQYGTTEGLPALREAFADNYNHNNIPCTPDTITIVGGSQQGIDLLSKIFLNPKDDVIVGDPTYLGGIGSFRTFQARFNTIPHDGKGMNIAILEETLENMKREGRRPKLIYVIPTFQNPSGTTMSEERRKRLVDLAHAYDTLIVEDDPYGRLRYGGEPVKPIICHDSGEDGRTIHLGTLSKTLAPGFRIATVVAPPDVTKKLVIAKQSSDLCTNTFTQFIASDYISQGHLEHHLEKIKKLYGGKMHAMIQAMDDFMPKGLEWTKPEGGMFLWITLPEGCNAVGMFPRAVEKKVAYVIGTAFYANGGGERCMRLNFSYPTDEQIRIGIERLAGVIDDEIQNSKDAGRSA